ncbi:predicted protein [Pyrenophora tritici-repentis Pt-1C-BFP]|uniref:Uncharacterized protein n=1 Tax=Pyrenophora tritici-repentis (strain Pt-1C-BFP) TaxID=426418 RepID=B2W814_PYRTR|nr:uncharacterized protein PTRG_05952 [Pyrenophora tritici-repentis Pt-1C-BFP]EDU48872.1 predicted protein [Pyrenophora tritici-repentis Pt-1C-BFP]
MSNDHGRRSPTLAAKFQKYVVAWNKKHRRESPDRKHELYRIIPPMCNVRHECWIQQSPIGAEEELEIVEHRIIDSDSMDTFWMENAFWTPFRKWVRNRYGGYEARQEELHVYYESTGIPFRFLDLPLELRYMVIRLVLGSKDIWPLLTPSHRQRLVASSHVEHREPETYQELSDRLNRYNGLSKGVYPIEFAAPSQSPMKHGYNSKHLDKHPETVHPGLGPTKQKEVTARNLLLVSKAMRKNTQVIIFHKTTKRFNELDDMTDIV